MEKPTKSPVLDRVEAALGKCKCDLILRGVRYVDVFACRWVEADVAIHSGHVVGLDAGLQAVREIDCRGQSLVPGFIDAHVHIESSMLSPLGFQQAVLPRGTTTAVCDPHELANVQGVAGIRYFLSAAETLALDLRVMLSSCVPATSFETNGGGVLSAADLVPLRAHPHALGLAEVMNVPGVLNGEPGVWDKLRAFAGAPIDGHCPLLRGKDLSAYASAGISSCHESTELEEAREKLTKGFAVWIREGSVAKDLAALIPLLTPESSARIGFCTDDRNPLDITEQGHIDYLIRQAIAHGVAPAVAYRSASWTVANHYGLKGVGAIAPGYRADLVLLDDLQTCSIAGVIAAGKLVSEMSLPSPPATKHPNSVRASPPRPEELVGPSGRVHIIGVQSGKILTQHLVGDSAQVGVAHLSVLERHGKGSPPANAYVRGFGTEFRGAIASSVGHDSHNLIAVGSDPRDMAIAMAALIESGGGFCIADGGNVKGHLALPLGGLMTDRPAHEIEVELKRMRAICREQGCALEEPFLALAFLCLPVIPALKLTDKGLFDVEAFQLIGVQAV